MSAFGASLSPRVQSAPAHRSRLAHVFHSHGAPPPGGAPSPRAGGFIASSNGATLLTPRSAYSGRSLQAPVPTNPFMQPTMPRAPLSPRSIGGTYSSLGPVEMSPRSPRAAATAAAASRPQSSRPQQRTMHMQREADMRRLVHESQQRVMYNQQRDKLKRLMRSVANDKEEVPIPDLLLTAELANVPLSDAQQKLLFKTPYANHYASTWEPNSPRSIYGLECTPRAVKWRAFDAALKHGQMNQDETERALQRYAEKEAKAIADAKAAEQAALEAAQRRAAESGKPIDTRPKISDDELRLVHKTVKQRLSTQFADIRTAFRTFDRDHSGHISPDECIEALMSLNVGVPRKFVEHLVNIADEDRDGEINYHEFTRILSADDITKIKVEGAEEQGLVQKELATWWNQAKNITREDMRSAQSMMAERLMERGGILKMFRVMDEDKSGQLSRGEVRMMVGLLNLETIIRPAVLEELVDMMDVDGDSKIMYKEFARVITAKDVFNLEDLQIVAAPEPVEKKMSKRQKALMAKRAMGLK